MHSNNPAENEQTILLQAPFNATRPTIHIAHQQRAACRPVSKALIVQSIYIILLGIILLGIPVYRLRLK
jgi:hypothetical protein